MPNRAEALAQALTDYMAAFGQGLEAHGIAFGGQQLAADEAARVALEAWRAQPEGWVMVPKEPTKAMLDAAWENTSVAEDDEGYREVYTAMIAAVDQPPGEAA